jgi:hypothetical protein
MYSLFSPSASYNSPTSARDQQSLYSTLAGESSYPTRDQGQLSSEQSRRHFTKIRGARNCNGEEETSDDVICVNHCTCESKEWLPNKYSFKSENPHNFLSRNLANTRQYKRYPAGRHCLKHLCWCIISRVGNLTYESLCIQWGLQLWRSQGSWFRDCTI